MNKKKLLALALVVIMIAIVSLSTLAWFTDEDEVKNTFTIGSVKIEQHEQQRGEDDELEEFEQGKMLLPIVNTEDPASDPNYQDKIVTVENTGKNDAYVRTFIAIPEALVGYLNLDVNAENWSWDFSGETQVGDVTYVAYAYIYNTKLEATDPNSITEPLLQGVYLYAEVDVKENPGANNELQFCKPDGNGGYTFSGFAVSDSSEITVLVASQAVQTEGFSGAKEALDAAFGSAVPEFAP